MLGSAVQGNRSRADTRPIPVSDWWPVGWATAARFVDAEPGLQAVDGSDPPLAMPSAGIAEGWDVHIPDTLPGGSLPSISPVREGQHRVVPTVGSGCTPGAAIGHIASPFKME